MSQVITEFIQALPGNSKIGVAAVNLANEKQFLFRAEDVFGTASVIKIAIALTLFKKAEQGELDLYQTFLLEKEDLFDIGFDDCGVLKYFQPRTPMSLYNACVLMLAMSDNTATNFILRFVPSAEINSFLKKQGFKKTQITISRLAEVMLAGAENNYVGLSTPWESVEVLNGLVRNTFLTPEHSEMIIRMMTAQQINHKIPRLLPSIRNNVQKTATITRIASKSGEFSTVKIDNDVAIIYTNGAPPMIMAIYTMGIKENQEDRRVACIDSSSARFIGDLAFKVYTYLK
jgi:beta-lactamase class A